MKHLTDAELAELAKRAYKIVCTDARIGGWTIIGLSQVVLERLIAQADDNADHADLRVDIYDVNQDTGAETLAASNVRLGDCFDDDAIEEIASALSVGRETHVGGGAAPLVRVTPSVLYDGGTSGVSRVTPSVEAR